jgi:hypothetical protein
MAARIGFLRKIWNEGPEARLETNAGQVRAVWRRWGSPIRWRPTHDTYYLVAALRTGADLPTLGITQTALLDLEAAIQQSRTQMPYGILAGQFCVCPETGEKYLLIDDVRPARAELTDRNFADGLRTELRSLADQAARRGKLLIGWYISGTGDDLRLEHEDLDLHREMFPEAWQIVLLHDNADGTERAALMRFESMTQRLYASPFFEMLPDAAESKSGGGDLVTVLPWANHRADQNPSRHSEAQPAAVREYSKPITVSYDVSPAEAKPESKAAPKRATVSARRPVSPPPNARLVFINGEIVAFSDERPETVR